VTWFGGCRASSAKWPALASAPPSDQFCTSNVLCSYCIATDEDRAALQSFEDQVIDRLFVLNAERAAAEAGVGKKSVPSENKARGKTKAETSDASPTQGTLF